MLTYICRQTPIQFLFFCKAMSIFLNTMVVEVKMDFFFPSKCKIIAKLEKSEY